MSIGRTREEQELTSFLAKNLVQKEVIEPMNKIGWSHAAPPPPDYSGPPAGAEGAPASPAAPAAPAPTGQPGAAPASGAPAAPAKADTPPATDIVATFESLRDPQGLIMGKYKTIEEALKGAGHLANMAKQSFQERDTALEQLRQVQELGSRPQPAAPAAAPAPTPPTVTASRAALEQAKAKLDAVLSGMEGDAVVDAETLKKYGDATREVAERAADLRVQESLHDRETAVSAEQNRWSAVDTFMEANHPNSIKHSAEIGLHIQSDPVLQAAVAALVKNGEEIKASVLAWQSYERAVSNGTAAKELAAAELKEEDLKAKEQVRQELRDKALKDAGVIASSAGGQGIHENTDGGAPSRDELRAAVSQMQMEGEGLGMPAATRFRHMLIGRHLDPTFFPPGR